MTEAEIKTYWYYFRSLSNQLRQTEQYVDHSLDANGNMLNGVAFSNEFAKLLMLASSEFEVISKALCMESGINMAWNANILSISRVLLPLYPHIGETVISTPYTAMQPLKDWKIIQVNGRNGQSQDVVAGIDWWHEHNGVKHNRVNNLVKANLGNCVNAMASLLVLEIYLSMVAIGNIDEISTRRCEYFDFEYGLSNLVTNPNILPPDFT